MLPFLRSDLLTQSQPGSEMYLFRFYIFIWKPVVEYSSSMVLITTLAQMEGDTRQGQPPLLFKDEKDLKQLCKGQSQTFTSSCAEHQWSGLGVRAGRVWHLPLPVCVTLVCFEPGPRLACTRWYKCLPPRAGGWGRASEGKAVAAEPEGLTWMLALPLTRHRTLAKSLT